MKKVILSIAVVMALATVASAQSNTATPASMQNGGQRPAKSPTERAQKDASQAEQKLGLNADQKAKWQAASLERLNANEPLKNQLRASADKTEKQKIAGQMKDNMKKFDDTVNGFLTADQKTKWEQAKQERKNMRQSKRGHGGTGMEPGN